MSEMFVVGDIHGEARLLYKALTDIEVSAAKVILLGDYVDRGPDSRGVVELLLCAKRRFGSRLTLLRGNHEVALLKYLETGDIVEFLAHDGLSTVHSYYPRPPAAVLSKFRRQFPAEHLELLMATELCYETDKVLVSHCGYNPAAPESRSMRDMCTQSSPDIFRENVTVRPRPLVVCGHYVQNSGVPFISTTLMCIDTGCGTIPGAPLTAVTIPSRRVRQYR